MIAKSWRQRVILPAVLLMVLSAKAPGQNWLWTSIYDGHLGHDIPTAIVCDRDDNIIVVGSTQERQNGAYDMVTIKYEPTQGETVWVRQWGTPEKYDSASSVVVDADNNVYVLGTSLNLRNLRNRYEMTLIKYLPNGDTGFVRSFADTLDTIPVGHCFGKVVALDPAGNIYLAGIHRTVRPWYDLTLVKYDPAGALLWSRYLTLPVADTAFLDHRIGMVVDRNGNAILTGPTKDLGYGRRDFLVAKYNSLGDTLWTRQWDAGSHLDDYPVAIACDDSGNVYVCGASDGGTEYDYAVVKYSANGTFRFQVRYNYQEYNGWDLPAAMAVGKDYSIIVTGASESEDGTGYCTVKFKADGSDTIWAARYFNGNEDEPMAIALDQYGNCYVTGFSDHPSQDFDATTIKYAPDGTQLWVQRYNGPPGDDADCGYALALDRKNNLYVAASAFNGGYMQDIATIKYAAPDVGCTRIVAPIDTIRVGRRITPAVWVRNYSPIAATFQVRIEMGPFWGGAAVEGLAGYESLLVTFPIQWTFIDSGSFLCRAYTQMTGDQEASNDTSRALVVVTLPWLVKANVPQGPKNKNVKDGGALAYNEVDNNIYCMKGNNTLEFYAYNCSAETWATRESVPIGTARRRVKKGAALAYGGNGTIYGFKGNRSSEFWAYNAAARSWIPKPNLPAPIKEGGAITWVPSLNRLYVLQGSNSQSFWAYSLSDETWLTMSPMPLGAKNKRPKDGSCIAFDGAGTIYALKGKTNEFYRYSVSSDVWTESKPIPLIGSSGKKKKTGGGTAMAFATGMVFAFKGNSVNEFWSFSPVQDSWIESDSLLSGLSRKRVKGGAALTVARNKIYALKGNNTLEFYLFNANVQDNPWLNAQTACVNPGPMVDFSLRVAPNPFSDAATVTYSLPRAGHVSLRLYDVSGSRCRELFAGRQYPGTYAVRLAEHGLASGVYFLKAVFDDGCIARELTSKVLVQKHQ